MPKDTGIGAPVVRSEDVRFTTGNGRYTDDFTCHGVHFAAFVRSPHAHAKITALDVGPAKQVNGVKAVYVFPGRAPGDGTGRAARQIDDAAARD